MMWKLASLALAAFVATALAQENVSEPDGYRTENYRAPVPATLAGRRVLIFHTAEIVFGQDCDGPVREFHVLTKDLCVKIASNLRRGHV